jgi:hypothetical protein
MPARRLAKLTTSLEQRLGDEAKRLREHARLLAHRAIRKARRTEVAAQMSDWLSSPGLLSPK